MPLADKYQQCLPSISNSYNSCGTMTRSSMKSLTVAQLATVFQDAQGNYRDMTSLLKSHFELKSCGIKVNGLYDWLMSSAQSVGARLNTRKISNTESLIEPFIFARQKSIINDEHWAIEAGYTPGAYTPGVTGPLTSVAGGDRVIRVFNRFGIDAGNEHFQNAYKVFIFSRRVDGTAEKSQWKILASAANTTTNRIDILLDEQNAGSASPSNSAPGANSFLVIGANDVGDWENYCLNRPAYNPNKLVPFFFQTSRYALCVDSMYKEYLEKAGDNALFEVFGDVPLVERNRQIGERFQREWLNSIFWGKPLANQTISTYTSLDPILSVDGQIMGYRANAVGIYDQLRNCGRVVDLQNTQLVIRDFLDDIYQVVRARESSGIPNRDVDVYTDSETAELFRRGMIAYFNAESAGLLRYSAPIEDGDIEGNMKKMGFYATSYKVGFPAGVTLHIITHPYFDDMLNAAKSETIGSTGRFLWVLDIGKGGSIWPGIVSSARVTTTVSQIELLRKVNPNYQCVISNPTRDITLNSQTWTAVVECPAANLIYENFSCEVPDGVNHDDATCDGTSSTSTITLTTPTTTLP